MPGQGGTIFYQFNFDQMISVLVAIKEINIVDEIFLYCQLIIEFYLLAILHVQMVKMYLFQGI